MTEHAEPSESHESKTPGALTRWPRDLTDLWAGWAPFGASIEQLDHRNGDQDHQQLPGVDGENIKLGTAPLRPMRRPDSAEMPNGLSADLDPLRITSLDSASSPG
jgi:hypothetical protein